MAQLSFDFADVIPISAEAAAGVVERRPSDELDRAYARASEWSRELGARLGRPVRLVITDNRSTMLSAKPRTGRLELRLHHMFLSAGDDILDAVADYVGKNDTSAGKRIDRFIREHRDRKVSASVGEHLLRAKGDVHDLQALMDDLAQRHFGGAVAVRISWGRRVKPKRGQRSIQLGTYLPRERLIRIHPALDQPWVPQFFVEAVVFHEMLHHDMPAVVHNGRQHHHTAAFRKRERAFEFYAAARDWEKENLWRLLRRR